MLNNDPDSKLMPKTILNTLIDRHPGVFDINKFKVLADTLRRNMNAYRAHHGLPVPRRKKGGSKSQASKAPKKSKRSSPPREREPAHMAEVDFTHFDKLGVTIQGKAVPLVLFDFRLPYSGWTYAEAFGGETAPALSQGLQNALVELGGVPEVLHRDRHGSAIWKGKAIPPFDQVLKHYSLQLSLSPQGCPWENGCVERTNGLVKENLEQILLLRGSSDFASQQDLQKEVQRAVGWVNRRPEVQGKLAEERMRLRPLPAGSAPTYKDVEQNVNKYGWINLYGCSYTVPLGVGKKVFVRMYDDRIEIYREKPEDHPGENLPPVITWPRLHIHSGAQIDFRHLLRPNIVELASALDKSQKEIREAMYPGECFKQTHRKLKNWCAQETYRNKRRLGSVPGYEKSSMHAGFEYACILGLATDTDLLEEVAQALRQLLKRGEPFLWEDVQQLMPSSPGRRQNIGTRPLF